MHLRRTVDASEFRPQRQERLRRAGDRVEVLNAGRVVLRELLSDLDRAVKTTVFLKSMDSFAAMNQGYAQYFGSTPPARTTVEVARLPRDVLIEIEVVAWAS